MTVKRTLVLVSLLYFETLHTATLTPAELCKEGDRDMCRVVELEKQIDFSVFNKERGRYDWALGPRTVMSIPANTTADRRDKMKTAACTFYSEVWLGEAVAEYGRLKDLRPVDRAQYRLCLDQQ